MAKPSDDFICPHCGKQTVVPVNYSGGDFFAVHSIQYGTRKGGIKTPHAHIVRQCTSNGMTSITDFIGCETIICDLPKACFDKNGKVIKSVRDRFVKSILDSAECPR